MAGPRTSGHFAATKPPLPIFGLLPRPWPAPRSVTCRSICSAQRWDCRCIAGPTGLSGLFWPDGERCAARAVTQAGAAYCLSHGSVCTLEKLAETGASPRWMQVFIYTDRGFTRELTARAAAAGFQALVLTIDNQLTGNRERDLRNGFTIPPRMGPVRIAGMALKPSLASAHAPRTAKHHLCQLRRPGEAASILMLAKRMSPCWTRQWTGATSEALRRDWHGPLLLKGVLHPDEAREAVARGVDGIIVSNHGGRQVDGAVSAADALPSVVEAAAGRVPVLLDGGVRRGADVVKALALGARACLIGRPRALGAERGGRGGRGASAGHISGVRSTASMGLCGVSRIADISPDLLMRDDCAPLGRPS